MAGISDDSLEARLADLEATVRALRTRNPLDAAAVVSPLTGSYVALSSIAFGQVVVVDGRDDVVVYGPIGQATGSGWQDKGGPYLDVYVTGGRLRVDFSTQLTVDGIQVGGGMSYVLRGPAATKAGAATAPVAAPGDTWRAVYLGDGASATARVNQTAGGSAFGVHTDLPVGWYRIAAVYAVSHSSTPAPAPFANFYGMTLAATPL